MNKNYLDQKNGKIFSNISPFSVPTSTLETQVKIKFNLQIFI